MTSDARVPYALWLCPNAATEAVLKPHLQTFAKVFNAPCFPPHITLSSGSYGLNNPLQAKALPPLSQGLPVTLRAEGVGCEDHFFTSLFLAFARDVQLNFLRKMACEFTRNEGPWQPHLSLAYTDAPLLEKQGAIGRLDFSSVAFVFDRVEVWGPEPGFSWRDVARWRRLVPGSAEN